MSGRVLHAIAAAMLLAVGVAPAAEVTIDDERMCPVVDGEPFFVIGACGIPPEQMKTAADAGFNLAIRWGSPFGRKLESMMAEDESGARAAIREYFDAAHKAGLWAIENPVCQMSESCSYGPGFHDRFVRFMRGSLPAIVNSVKDHPALFGYYGSDEPGEEHRSDCDAYSRIVRQHDPDHPLFFLYSGDIPAWPGNICEIIDMNGYPLAGTNYGHPIASADVNFDRKVFLRCTARDQWEAIREKYGAGIELELMHAQGTFSIASKMDDVSAEDIGREFGLDARREYFAMYLQQRAEALGDPDRG